MACLHCDYVSLTERNNYPKTSLSLVRYTVHMMYITAQSEKLPRLYTKIALMF